MPDLQLNMQKICKKYDQYAKNVHNMQIKCKQYAEGLTNLNMQLFQYAKYSKKICKNMRQICSLC